MCKKNNVDLIYDENEKYKSAQHRAVRILEKIFKIFLMWVDLLNNHSKITVGSRIFLFYKIIFGNVSKLIL